jgi:hypothetical protein
MTSEERIKMERLVRLIQDEHDHTKFLKLMSELNGLLECKERRLTVEIKKTQGLQKSPPPAAKSSA